MRMVDVMTMTMTKLAAVVALCACRQAFAVLAYLAVVLLLLPHPSEAQQAVPPPWKTDAETRRRIEPPQPAPPAVPPSAGPAEPQLRGAMPVPSAPVPAAPSPAKAQLTLAAYLTQDGEPIDQGLVWRVYVEPPAGDAAKPRLVGTYREAAPVVALEPGTYVVNVAFGRAHLTRKIAVPKPGPVNESFVLNAGGLRVTAALASGEKAPDLAVGYDLYQGDSDQLGGRTKIIGGVRPGVIVRLNAGLYHIASSLGDANAVVNADVTVEAGKLTDATVSHYAARITLKLVTRAGGEAQAATQWAVHTAQGDLVRESQGALPSHVLAAGKYVASARHAGKLYQREFTVTSGESAQVEIVMP